MTQRSLLTVLFLLLAGTAGALETSFYLPDTGQVKYYDDHDEISRPVPGKTFFGQDANYRGNSPKYTDNKDGTVTDHVTGLMWQKDPGEKMTLADALSNAAKCRTGGHADWRLPNIKELYSLILFSGVDPDPRSRDASGLKPFIDTSIFKFQYGREDKNERIIDSQYATSTKYVSTTMRNDATMFGVNFADGRIKGYPIVSPRTRRANRYYVIYVRGNRKYGKNDFVDNKNGTVTDRATGLMWMSMDSGNLKAGKKSDGKLNWEEALAWAENLEYAGHSDWRLPNAKELQSIVDYTRSPATTQSAAIDPVFKVSTVSVNGDKRAYPFYWTGTTHVNSRGGSTAVYVAFGNATGWMRSRRGRGYSLMDVHGAGAQRSDPKAGDPSRFPHGRGPQGDVIRIFNFARCVRGGSAK